MAKRNAFWRKSKPAGSPPVTTQTTLDRASNEYQYLLTKLGRKSNMEMGRLPKAGSDDELTAILNANLAKAWADFKATQDELKAKGYDYYEFADEIYGKPIPTSMANVIPEFKRVTGPKGNIYNSYGPGDTLDAEMKDLIMRGKQYDNGPRTASDAVNRDQEFQALKNSLIAKGVDLVKLEKDYPLNMYGDIVGQNAVFDTNNIVAEGADATRRMMRDQKRTRPDQRDDSNNQTIGADQRDPSLYYVAPTTTLEQRRAAYIQDALKGEVYTYVENGGPNAGKLITVLYPSGPVTGDGEIDPELEKHGLNVRQLVFDQSKIDPEGYMARMGMVFIDGIGWTMAPNSQEVIDNYAKTKGVWNNLTGQYDKVGADGTIIPSPPLPRNADGSFATPSYVTPANSPANTPVNNSPGAVDTGWIKKPDLTPEQADKNLAALYDEKGKVKPGVTPQQLSKALVDGILARGGIIVDNGMAFIAAAAPLHTERYALPSPENLKARGFIPGYYNDSLAESLGPDALGHYHNFETVLGADGQYWTAGVPNGLKDTIVASNPPPPLTLTDEATVDTTTLNEKIAAINSSSASQDVKNKALFEVHSGSKKSIDELLKYFAGGGQLSPEATKLSNDLAALFPGNQGSGSQGATNEDGSGGGFVDGQYVESGSPPAKEALVGTNDTPKTVDQSKLIALQARARQLEEWGGPGYDGMGPKNDLFPDVTTDAQYKSKLAYLKGEIAAESGRVDEAKLTYGGWGNNDNANPAITPGQVAFTDDPNGHKT